MKVNDNLGESMIIIINHASLVCIHTLLHSLHADNAIRHVVT